MKIPYFCCIGAELKRYAKDFDFMNQVYLYKVPTDDTIEEVFAQDYFQPVADTVLQDDLLYIYEPTAQVLHTCRFNKQNGHIAVEQMANNIPALTPNKILISDEDGKIAAGDLSLEDIVVKISTEKQIMQGGLQTPELETDDLTVNGTAEFDNAPTTNDTTTYQNATSDSLVRKEQVDEVIQDIKTSSLTFIGYVSATEPSSATYAFNTGDLWLNSATMPTTFPFPQANIKEWNGSAWVAYSQNYTPANFDFFRNVNNNEGYYWFGGEWVVMSTDMSTTYFQLNAVSGKWEIKSNVNLPGAPTTTTPSTDDNSTKIATTAFVKNALDEKGSGSGRNIGDTFMTKRTDTSLAGAVECDGATYNTTDFTGDGSIGELLEAGKLDCVSLRAYSTAISTKGWCDKIGWNGPGTTSFRVPTLTPHIIQKNNIPVVGNGMTLGLTNGTQNVGLTSSQSNTNSNGAFEGLYGANIGTNASGSRATYNLSLGVATDPTKSGVVADTTDTAQLRVMIQIANSATDEALETCTNVLADVAALKYDYVVDFQAPTAENDYTWYRKYKSGWVEQGGTLHVLISNASKYSQSLPIAMADTHYTVTIASCANHPDYYTQGYVLARTTTTVTLSNIRTSGSGTYYVDTIWQVSGMAAQ